MRDPREIYPGEPISSILNRLHAQNNSSTPTGNSFPVPEWLGVTLVVAFVVFGAGVFTINQLIDHGFFG